MDGLQGLFLASLFTCFCISIAVIVVASITGLSCGKWCVCLELSFYSWHVYFVVVFEKFSWWLRMDNCVSL